MPRRVLIVYWNGGAYDSLRGLLRLAGQELADEGYEIVELRCGVSDWRQELIGCLQGGGISFALGMSGVGSDLRTGDKRLLWEAAGVPFFDWNCDHPCYFPSRHRIRSRFLLHGYVFPDHARYSLEHFNANGATFGVHIGIPPRTLFSGMPRATGKDRILFAKSGGDASAIEARWRGTQGVLAAVLLESAEELFHRSTEDFFPVLLRTGERHGVLMRGDSELAMMLMFELDSYIRIKRANMVMRVALDYPVDVYGTGWDHIASGGTKAAFKGPLDWRRMLDLLPRYQASLSINPLVEESVHDRVFFALAAGVVPITDSNRFWRTHMPELEPYGFGFTPDRIRAAIEAVLADPPLAAERTAGTYDRLVPEFSMRRSVQHIAAFAALHSVNARSGA
ncbi:MAG: glycosyltransferase family protein [Acetobacteraceae bacterium]